MTGRSVQPNLDRPNDSVWTLPRRDRHYNAYRLAIVPTLQCVAVGKTPFEPVACRTWLYEQRPQQPYCACHDEAVVDGHANTAW